MSGLRSRRKGHDFERYVADLYRETWPSATVRRSSQGDGAHEPDVVVEGDAPHVIRRLWSECQHAAVPTPLIKLTQAERDVAASPTKVGIPIVVWRKTGNRTSYVTTRLWTFFALGLATVAIDAEEMTVTIDLAEFLAAMKRLHP